MWFKNLQVYRLPAGWDVDVQRLDAQLAGRALQGCGAMDMQSAGWLSPRGDERFLYVSNRQLLLACGAEQKLLPMAVVNQVAQERAAEISAREGRPVGRRELRELKAEEVLGLLLKSVDDLPARLLKTHLSPGAAMTAWLSGGEAPAGFTLDRDLELRAPGDERATVRYVRHALEGGEIRAHIAQGKSATRLGMTWNDRISFVLTEDLQIKRLAFLDILKEESEGQAESDDERFEIDFALMTGELAKLLSALVEVLGGETQVAG